MPRWIETTYFQRFFEIDHERNTNGNRYWRDGIREDNYWRPNQASQIAKMKELTDYCNKFQYEVKSIIPLTKAQSYEYGIGDHTVWHHVPAAGGWGLGQGWGVNYTYGFLAVLQRIEEVTLEVYQQRLNQS